MLSISPFTQDESLAPVPQAGAEDFESCKSICLVKISRSLLSRVFCSNLNMLFFKGKPMSVSASFLFFTFRKDTPTLFGILMRQCKKNIMNSQKLRRPQNQAIIFLRQCLCYAGGDRHCNSYAVRLDVPPGGDLGTCLSQSVDGRFEIILPALFFLSFNELFQLPC